MTFVTVMATGAFSACPDSTLPGWRILMMCLEHEVHHRSQIDTYAGLQGWDPPHIYGRSAEQVGLERERQRELYRDIGGQA